MNIESNKPILFFNEKVSLVSTKNITVSYRAPLYLSGRLWEAFFTLIILQGITGFQYRITVFILEICAECVDAEEEGECGQLNKNIRGLLLITSTYSLQG